MIGNSSRLATQWRSSKATISNHITTSLASPSSKQSSVKSNGNNLPDPLINNNSDNDNINNNNNESRTGSTNNDKGRYVNTSNSSCDDVFSSATEGKRSIEKCRRNLS
ncbi:unnamed protein product [Thelazia callipaeda]|uniref:Myb domain-containing protein n=1 Tax=Thelazia callipaeda TaxID=103827 RepID=A0A0N5CJ24_THECL|nr:unnamed protein product [Thelazia callipaeda]